MHRLRRHLQRLTGGSAAGPPSGRFFGPGEIRYAILSLLGDGPAHGYELMTRLEERCGGAYQASAGTVYPTLQQLEDEDLVRAAADSGKKVYTLTTAGRRELDENAAKATAIWRRAEEWSEWGVMSHPDGAEMLGPALRLAKAALKTVIKSRGDAATIDAVRNILDEARERIDLLRSRRRR